jgi:CRISPR system Cascade subunit CasD
MSTLALILDSPLQSWGHASQFTHRTTGSFPTKSGVIGLIAAAMGIDKHAPDEPQRLAPLAALDFSVVRVPKPAPWGKEPLTPGRLEDYHTVGGGYDDEDPRQKLHIPKKAERGGSFGTVLTHRHYLTQTQFIALLTGPEEMLKQIATALEDPVWGIWLGRKCCIPALPVLAHIASGPESALKLALTQIGKEVPTELEQERSASTDAQAWLADQPLSYGSRSFATRGVSRLS